MSSLYCKAFFAEMATHGGEIKQNHQNTWKYLLIINLEIS